MYREINGISQWDVFPLGNFMSIQIDYGEYSNNEFDRWQGDSMRSPFRIIRVFKKEDLITEMVMENPFYNPEGASILDKIDLVSTTAQELMELNNQIKEKKIFKSVESENIKMPNGMKIEINYGDNLGSLFPESRDSLTGTEMQVILYYERNKKPRKSWYVEVNHFYNPTNEIIFNNVIWVD